jgi:hypothetical protein
VYNIICAYVLVKLIDRHTHEYNKPPHPSSLHKWSDPKLVPVVHDKMPRNEAELALIRKRHILFRDIDQATAQDIIRKAINAKYVSPSHVTKPDHRDYLAVEHDGDNLVSGPLYAGIINEVMKGWHWYWQVVAAVVTSGFLILIGQLIIHIVV